MLGWFRKLLLLTTVLIVPWGCGSDDDAAQGACAVCDRAPDATCRTTCERVCGACSPVKPEEVDDVQCKGETLNVYTKDGVTHACSKN